MNLDDDQFLVLILNDEINAVEFVGFIVTIALTFQQRNDFNLLLQQGGEEAFENIEIGFVAQNLLAAQSKLTSVLVVGVSICFSLNWRPQFGSKCLAKAMASCSTLKISIPSCEDSGR